MTETGGAHSPAVEVEGVSFSYDQRKVLHDVSFTVDQGDYVGIIGPNGGGKTTLLRLLMGLLKPQTGCIRLFGHSPADSHSRIAYVPQNLRFDRAFPITAREVVLGGTVDQAGWFGKFPKEAVDRTMAALAQVRMSQHASVPFGALSGGQAQRTLIARALASDPDLLLLDEPTANVDSEGQQEIYDLVRKLSGEHTVLMVTHDLPVVINQVNKVLCVQNKVVTFPPEKVCEHYAVGLYHTPLIDTELEENS